ncbi:MAG: hypothetical protein AAGH88_14175 [Planctomycetota bacterium]
MPQDGLSTLPRASEQISLDDAYRAMLRLLKYYYKMDANDELGAMLGDLDTGVWADRAPGDAAAWSLWLDSIDGKEHGA